MIYLTQHSDIWFPEQISFSLLIITYYHYISYYQKKSSLKNH